MDREYVATITTMVEEGMEAGEFSSFVDPRTATLALIGALNWMTHWYRPDGPTPATVFAEQISTMFLHGAVTRAKGLTKTSATRSPATNSSAKGPASASAKRRTS